MNPCALFPSDFNGLRHVRLYYFTLRASFYFLVSDLPARATFMGV